MNITNCPYCGRELEPGTFRSRGANYFRPDNQRPPLWYTRKSLEACNCIMFPPDIFLWGNKEHPVAYVCRHCKKMIVPFE